MSRVTELTARRERLFETALEVAEREPFLLADRLAYRSLLEQIEGLTELISFEEKSNAKPKRARKTVHSNATAVA